MELVAGRSDAKERVCGEQILQSFLRSNDWKLKEKENDV